MKRIVLDRGLPLLSDPTSWKISQHLPDIPGSRLEDNPVFKVITGGDRQTHRHGAGQRAGVGIGGVA